MYNSYNLEPAGLESSLEIFKNFLVAEKISEGSIRSYLSDVRFFFNWLDGFLKENHINHPSSILKYVNPKLLEAYKNYLLENNIPIKTINRRFSSLRKFGNFCQSQGWLVNPSTLLRMNPFDVLRNIPEEEKPFPENEYHLEEFKVHLWKNRSSKATIKNYLNDVKQFILWKSKNI